MMGLFLLITALAALSYSGMRDHPGGGIAAVASMGRRDPLGIYPLVLAGFLPWSAIGLLRLLLESIIGTVVWIIPAGDGGPLDFGRVKALKDGSNTVAGIALPADGPGAGGARQFPMMWLGGVGGERRGALMKWNAEYELVLHRYAEKCGRERLRGFHLPRQPRHG